MKGLLIKDASVLINSMRFFLVLSLIMAIFPSDTTRGFAIIYAVLTPMSAFALDEQAKWNELAVMMPYKTTDFVLSKYLLGIGGAAAVSVISAVSGLFLQNFGPEGMRNCLMLNAEAIFALFGGAMILLAINLPILFALGVEKGRIAYILVSVGIAAGFVSQVGTGYKAWALPHWISSASSIAAGVVLLLISVLLSIKIYDSKKS